MACKGEDEDEQSVVDQSFWCVFNEDRYRKIKNIKELPDYQKLLVKKIPQEQQV